MTYSIYLKYIKVIREIDEIPLRNKAPFAEELVKRHTRWWPIPITTYRRRKHILVYRDKLERESPYYADLLSIENKDHLKTVLLDLYDTMNVKFNYER